MTGVMEVGEVSPGVPPAWGPGGEFTVGAEDELLLVDNAGALVGAAGRHVVAEAGERAPDSASVQAEIFADQIEFGSDVGTNAEEVARSLGRLRAQVTGAARLMGVGMHPAAPLGDTSLSRSQRYDWIAAELAGLLRTPTSAFQVHVGFPDPATAIRGYRGLRNRLPLLRALAAGSPYWHGVDSGLATARSAVLRSYPRTVLPPAVASWEEYSERVDDVVDSDQLPDYTYIWWELRLQPRLGTVEVRVMDAQASLARVAGLSALVQGLARYAVEAPDATDMPHHVLQANDLAACRDGLDATVVGRDGLRWGLRELAVRALVEARAVLAPDGLAAPLDVVEAMLTSVPEPVRQRRLVEEQGMDALLADLVDRTARGIGGL